ncbi:MAG: hypothetical protein SO434_04320 [Eubacteriales bacterium]|nr:hypothetical protein [Eubacteriales bacterium]
MRVQQSNIRDIKSVALKDFRGVDMASAPSDVAYFRATKMSNFIYEDGLNRKRKGIEQLFHIKPSIDSEPCINGIFDFTIEGTRLKIVYAGNRFYIVQDNGKYIDITTTQFTFDEKGNVELGAIIDNKFRVDVQSGEATEGAHYLQDTRCQAFVSNDKIYFVGMGDYLVLGKFDGNNFELRKVYENEEYTTIPTTTMLIAQIGKDNEGGKILDDVNIMTRLRYNRLVGSAFTESETAKSWRLDGQVDGNASITIEVSNTKEKIDLSVSDENAEVYRFLRVGDDLSNKTLTYSPYKMGTVIYGANVVTTESGEKIFLSGKYKDSNDRECFDLIYSNGETDTTIAKYSRSSWLEQWTPSAIENSIKFGQCGKCTSLYVMFSSEFSGNFPILNTKKIINESEEQVGNLKDNIITLYSNVGDLSSSILGEDNIKVRYRAVFDNSASERIRKAKIGTIFGINGADDRLFLADGSVTDTYSERNDFSYFGSMNYINTGTAPIVGYIRLGDSTLGVLKKDSTQDAALYVRSGQYLKETIDNVEMNTQALFNTIPTNASVSAVGNIGNATLNNDSMILTRQGIYGVEIASNISTNQRLLKLRSNAVNKGLLRLDLDNVISFVYDNKMYVAQGEKCFVADARFKYRTDNDMGDTFNYEWWQLDFPCDIRCFAKFDDRLVVGTKDGRIIALQGTNYVDQVFDTYEQGQISTTTDSKITYNSKIDISKYQRLEFLQDTFPIMYMGKFVRFDGSTIIIDNTYVLKEGETYQENTSDNTVVVIGKNLKGEKLHIDNYDNNNIVLRDDYGNVYSSFQTNAESANNDVRLSVITPVKAEWYSAITDLGNCSVLKSLVSMTIAVDEQSRGKVQIGYETRRAGESIYESTSLGGFDFANIDFTEFSFLPEFDCAFTKKVMARNFNYILFKVKSETPSPCALKEIIVRYKQTKVGRGVR